VCTNSGCQIRPGDYFSGRPAFVGPQYGSCCMLPFWHLRFSNFFLCFWKVVLTLGLIILVRRTSLDFGHRDSSQESTYSNYYILILANSFLFNITLRITGGDAYFALCNLVHKSAIFSVWTPNILNIIKVYYSPINAQGTLLKTILKFTLK